MLPGVAGGAGQNVTGARGEGDLGYLAGWPLATLEAHTAGRRQGDPDHLGAEHGGVAVPADGAPRRVPGDEDLSERGRVEPGQRPGPVGQPRQLAGQGVGRDQLPGLIPVVQPEVAHGPPGGPPVHGDGVELHRLEDGERLLFLGFADQVRSVHQTTWGGRTLKHRPTLAAFDNGSGGPVCHGAPGASSGWSAAGRGDEGWEGPCASLGSTASATTRRPACWRTGGWWRWPRRSGSTVSGTPSASLTRRSHSAWGWPASASGRSMWLPSPPGPDSTWPG